MRRATAARFTAHLAAAALSLLLCSCAGPRAAAPPPLPPAPPAPAPPPPSASPAEADSLLGVWWPVLGAPRVDSAGRVDWSPRPRWSHDAARARGELRRAGDSLAAWRAIAVDTAGALRPFALRRLAADALATGDTAAADRWLEALAHSSSPWSWEALRTRCDLGVAARASARAESLLAKADRAEWSELDRAAWLVRRATLAAARGDTLRSAELAHQALRRYPATPPAGSAAALLERLAATGGRPLALEDLEQAAEAARLRGDRAEAVRYLERAHARSRGEARARVGLELARTLREARRFDAGLGVVARDAMGVKDAGLRARLGLERARLLRDGGRKAEALKAYAALERAETPADVVETAAWERAIELVSAGRYASARPALAYVAERGDERAPDAKLLLGLSWIADGRASQATAAWKGGEGEAFEFWRAVLARRAAGDSAAREGADRALASIAARPGYGFYRVAARDTLGVRGWPGSALVGEPCRERPAALDLAEGLLALGESDGAMLVIQRWSVSTPRPAASPGGGDSAGCEAAALIETAELAAAAGRLPTAIRLAQKALDASPRADSRVAWGLVAHGYPPALETLYAAIPESVGSSPLDRSLLRAVAWQESRFDRHARSRSDALGLYQLKIPTAGDMARRLGEPKPTREALFDGATSLRYGREYLQWLLERFDGQWIVALSAYNSGPSSVVDGWRSLLERGGSMLFCELIGRSETRDYVRKILGARQAYRELRPLASPAAAPPR